jgi:hypothetical protein
MANNQDDLKKTKIMIIIEILLIIATIVVYLLLENIIVGIFYMIFVLTISSWIILVFLTIYLYNKTKKSKESD